jgi:hypothetical protein
VSTDKNSFCHGRYLSHSPTYAYSVNGSDCFTIHIDDCNDNISLLICENINHCHVQFRGHHGTACLQALLALQAHLVHWHSRLVTNTED